MTSAFDRLRAKEDRDVRAPDGLLDHGWRWVRAPGRLKYGGQQFAHEKLKDFIGHQVKVHTDDYHVLAVKVSDARGKFIVRIES